MITRKPWTDKAVASAASVDRHEPTNELFRPYKAQTDYLARYCRPIWPPDGLGPIGRRIHFAIRATRSFGHLLLCTFENHSEIARLRARFRPESPM